MKPYIHPQFFENARAVCACGNSFVTGSTKQNITIEVCNRCHPFYTGEHRYVDIKGRVESFQKKQQLAKKYQALGPTKKHKKDHKEEKKVKTLKELLREG